MFDYRRTHDCGTLTATDIGNNVTLSGWVHRRRDHGGLIFIDLRDRYGITQLVFDPKINAAAHEKAESLRSEWVLSIYGKVIPRAEGMTNPKMATGEIEIEVEHLEILSCAKTPPFSISDETIDVREDLRLKYRYLDMRRGGIIQNLKIRHQAILTTRNFLSDEGFLEVTTPILSKSTPEGARDYLVPSRIHKGNFYALPQSPQIFKQLLMIGGLDKYFQVCSCFRDEDLRADRQPEFSQVDLEMSFQNTEGIFELIERLMQQIFKECLNRDVMIPFPRLTYRDVLEYYGTDKPDLRFEMQLIRLDEEIKASDFSLLKETLNQGGCVKALCVKGGAAKSRREIDNYTQFVSRLNIPGLAWMKKTEEGWSSTIVKFFSEPVLKSIDAKTKAEIGDLLLIAGEKEFHVNQAMDHLRRHIAKEDQLIREDELHFLWVNHFPMFSRNPDTGEIESEHHPFTGPHEEDVHLIDTDPLKVRALAYDLVLNGYEIASGSQRIHDADVQKQIFERLKLSEKEIHDKFGYFIEALKYGTPPHIGLAFGVDRLSMILTHTENIRDVIAFPKTQKASDLMMQTPSKITQEQLKELNIEVEDAEDISWP